MLRIRLKRLLAAAALAVMLLLTGCFATDPAAGKLNEPKFPLAVKGLHFGISLEECRTVLGAPEKEETVSNEDGSISGVTICTYQGLDTVFGKSVSADLYFYEFADGDYSPGLMEVFSTGLSRITVKFEEASREKLYKKLDRIYGPLTGGETAIGQQIGKAAPGLYNEHYVNEKASLPNLSEEDRSLLYNINPSLRTAADPEIYGLTEVELGGLEGKNAEISVNVGKWLTLKKAKAAVAQSGPPVIREAHSSPVRADRITGDIQLSFEGGDVFGTDPGNRSVRLKNTGDKDCDYGYMFTVEEKRGDRWVVLEPDQDLYFKAVALPLPAHEERVTNYNIGEMFTKGLTAGRYRLVLEIGVLQYATAEFTVDPYIGK